MKKNEILLDAVADISKEYISEAYPENTKVITHKKNISFRKVLVAACAVAALAVPCRYFLVPVIQDAYHRSALSDVSVSDIIKSTKAGYELGWTCGFTGDVTITDRDGNQQTVMKGFSSIFKSYEDFDKVSDAYYYDDVLFTISASQMTVTANGKTNITERKFDAGSRILGYDTGRNLYILCTDNENETAEIQKYSIEGELINRTACSSDIPLNEFSGFESIDTDGNESSHILSYLTDKGTAAVHISYNDDGKVIMTVSQDDSEQIISTKDDGSETEYISGDSIFTIDENTKIFADSSGTHRISTDLSYSETRKEFNREQGTHVLNDIRRNGNGYSYEMGLGYNNLDYLVLFMGTVGDKVVLNAESAAREGISEKVAEKINSALQKIETDADGGAEYVGGDSETGYIMVMGHELEIDFYSFEMNGENTEKIASVFYPMNDDVFQNVEDFGFGGSVYYNGACYGVMEFSMTDGSVKRFVCTCDSEGRTGYAEMPSEKADADDEFSISKGKVGFLKKDGSFYSSEFVYD